MSLTTLTRITIFWGIISKTTQLTIVFTSVPQFHDHKFISGFRGSTIELRTGFDSYLTCGFLCIQKPLCTAINYCTATDGSSVCEFLTTNICVSDNNTGILQSRPGCRFWDALKDSSACVATTPKCITIQPDYDPQGRLICDTSIRTCREYYLQYNNKPNALTSHFYLQIWPKGILGPPINAECESGSYMYIFKRDVNVATGKFTPWNFNSSFEAISYTVERRIYSRLCIFVTGINVASSYYSVQSFQKNGSLSVTFLSSDVNYDVLGLNGNPLVNAPFLNHSKVNPECGPFWLLPKGNLSCPGGEQLRFWGPIKYNGSSWDTGYRCAKSKNRFSLGFIRLDL